LSYKCTACGDPAAYLLEGGKCPRCFVPEQITDLPKPEKASFTVDINAIRKQIRRQKRGVVRKTSIKKFHKPSIHRPAPFRAYLIEKNGLYRQNAHGLFGPRSTAKIYRTKAFAELSVAVSGKGNIIEIKGKI
jgi:hypothetical protein